MLNKVALLDLEQYTPTVHCLRDLLEQNDVVYLFHCQDQFNYALADLTELATWICSGEVVILETGASSQKEFEYAMLVGQLLALIDAYTRVELLSAMPSSQILLQLMQDAELICDFSPLEPTTAIGRASRALTKTTAQAAVTQFLSPILEHSRVDQFLSTCIHTLEQQPVKPLQQFSKWLQSIRSQPAISTHKLVDSVEVSEPEKNHIKVVEQVVTTPVMHAQAKLNQNFNHIDRVQVAVLRKLNQLQEQKPKDIYALRDLLAEMFPESDVRRLLKELLEKGYIYWNGHEVIYSHEMVLN